MPATDSPQPSEPEIDVQLQLLKKAIYDEEVPERLLELARKLQSALNEREQKKT